MIDLPHPLLRPLGEPDRFGRVRSRRVFTSADGVNVGLGGLNPAVGLQWSPDPRTLAVRFRGVAGGGGGGHAPDTAANQASAGSGGYAGGYLEAFLARGAGLWAMFRLEIGLGGTGFDAAGGSGTHGGSTSIEHYGVVVASCSGGLRGNSEGPSGGPMWVPPNTSPPINNTNDISTQNGLRLFGGGQWGHFTSSEDRGQGGGGGSGPFGVGGAPRFTEGPGNSAAGYGGGGGGGLTFKSAAAGNSGGGGSDGILIVEEYW